MRFLDAIGREVRRIEVDAAEPVQLKIEEPRQLDGHAGAQLIRT